MRGNVMRVPWVHPRPSPRCQSKLAISADIVPEYFTLVFIAPRCLLSFLKILFTAFSWSGVCARIQCGVITLKQPNSKRNFSSMFFFMNLYIKGNNLDVRHC